MLYDHALHSICIFTMFHAFRYVFICWKLCDDRFGLGWTHNAIFFAYHMFMHFSCICTIFFSIYSVVMVLFCLSPSPFLSLSRIVFAWHPNANPFCLGTFFILGHLPLILLLFTFSSMIRKPVRTSWRTSPNVVFIRNAAWFYRTFLILLYPLSFIVGDGNLYVRYPWVVPPWSYESSTPICMVSIPLYLVRYTDSRYTYRSHSGAHF